MNYKLRNLLFIVIFLAFLFTASLVLAQEFNYPNLPGTDPPQEFLTTAEKFSTINDLLFPNYDYPRLAINNVWQGKLWVHEHNWGGTDGDITEVINNIINDYLTLFENTYLESTGAFVYEDALELVQKVKEKRISFGLLTGNVKRGAEIKLNRFDLMKHFSFGAFGEDGSTRSDLPIVARKRAQEILGKSFEFEDIVLVGDTPEDAIAAKINGCKSIIVCRRQEWYNEIVKSGADLVVERLDDPAIII